MLHFLIYMIIWTLRYSCLAVPDIHKQMTASQLQSVFHVDSHDLVPHYEVISLTHHGTLHKIHKRSIITSSNVLNTVNSVNNELNQPPSMSSSDKNIKQIHHVKKDLSKSAYFSKLKNRILDNTSDSVDHNKNTLTSFNTSEKNNLSNWKEHNVSLSAFGKVYNLSLHPTVGLFRNGIQGLRMWTVKTNNNATQGLQYEEVNEHDEDSEQIGEIFQDQSQMASILMRRQLENGDLLMEGSIGHNIVIRPLPTDLSHNFAKNSAHHVVYKKNADPIDQLSDYAYMEPDRLIKRYRRSASDFNSISHINMNSHGSNTSARSKRSVPHIIYPEILVIVDYDGYRLHGGDNVQVKRYFISFWNGVDLRYRLLKGPRIRISIAGIIISRGRDATPYLERNRVGRDAIDSAAALTDMGKYLFRERRLPVYDIAVAITKYDMCRRRKGGRCTKGTAGFAYVGGACVVNKRLEKVNSVAIIEDTGGFSGIIVAAHEVGHLLGAVHDGSPPPSYLGGPGAEKCRWEDGFIMSDLRHTERGFRWSPCTIQSFHHFLNGDTASCLHNAPHEDEALGRALPGTLLSLDAQCRRDRGTSACFKDERVCAQLFCFDAASGYCVAYRPAAEGSPCGDGSHCLDGICVAENENIIPDYSQHTPSYASPNAYNSQLNTESNNYNEAPSSRETTRSTTTTTTTTSSTSPTPINTQEPRKLFNTYYNNVQQYSTSSENSFKFFYQTTSSTASPNFDLKRFFDFTTSTKAPQNFSSTTTNPFYYGFNNQKSDSNSQNDKPQYETSKSTSTSAISQYPTNPYQTSTKSPYAFNHFFYSQSSTNTKPSSTLAPYAHFAQDLHKYSSSAKPLQQVSYASAQTRNPVFDVYLKRLASTTKSPYNFENFAEYFKTSTTNPRFAFNLFGANSNNLNSTETPSASLSSIAT